VTSRTHKFVSRGTESEFLVGRGTESVQIRACLQAGRNVLLEGPVGVGKTHLALAVAKALGQPVFRVDGDSRYSEQKLAGWFDPPLVMKQGFNQKTFIPGPLVEAMQTGGVLFINELNRLPEGVQNILLPAIDEKFIVVPRLGEVRAHPGFRVIATQNIRASKKNARLSVGQFNTSNPIRILSAWFALRETIPWFEEGLLSALRSALPRLLSS
jgi:MoxR-like ATPase